ncbi:uncharacterized protein LOC116758299 [Phocoena sinus]|uniref:uncharacterized protein LOC116758299 n=1 Tax=Phocoena sinus TaxID=42100 RepID=UPI0013C43231|nr:uncharacterized protein LOC116758299 [Phocoena sinus]
MAAQREGKGGQESFFYYFENYTQNLSTSFHPCPARTSPWPGSSPWPDHHHGPHFVVTAYSQPSVILVKTLSSPFSSNFAGSGLPLGLPAARRRTRRRTHRLPVLGRGGRTRSGQREGAWLSLLDSAYFFDLILPAVPSVTRDAGNGRRRKQAEWGWERSAVAERKGPGCHHAASPGASELGAATPPAGQDSIPPRKGSGFLSGPPQGKINHLWRFAAFLIFNKTIVGGWPQCLLLGGSKPAHSRARGGASAAQPAGREQCLFVAGPRGSCGPPRPGPSP